MVKLSPSGRTMMRDGDINVSRPAVVRALQTLNLPQDLVEKLNHIGKSRKQAWANQSGKLLLALSMNNSKFMSVARGNSEKLKRVIDARFDNLTMNRAVQNQGEFSDSFIEGLDAQVAEILMQLINFEVS